METVRQACPQCGATLELPAAAIGRTARCPSCQGTFVVAPASAPAGSSPAASSPAAGPPAGSATPAGANPPNPNLSGVNPAGAAASGAPPDKPRESFGGAGGEGFGMPVQRPSVAADNPYAVGSGMAAAAMEPTKHGELLIQTPSIDAIVSAATAIFTERWQPLVIAGLIMFVFNILSNFGGQVISMVVGNADQGAMFAVSMLLQFALSLIGFYLTCGLIRVALAVARNQPAPVSLLFPNPGLFGRVVLTMLLPILGLIALGAILGGLGAAIFFATGQAEAAGIAVMVIGFVVFFVAYFAIFFLLWPAVYLVVDGRGSGMSALRTGAAIGLVNKLNSFLFMLIGMALAIVGLLACCVGQIATTPATFLVAAVGYLMMTSQPVSDPSQPTLGQAPLGYGNPGYGDAGYGNSGYGNEPYGPQS